MAGTAEKTNPALWDKVKAAVTKGDKGGRAGQWSARKAQLAVHDYKAQGGGYRGGKSADNHLRQWTREEWGTRSGKTSGETGERYLPRRAREQLSEAELAETTAKKRRDAARGKQFSAQPKAIAKKAAATRKGGAAPPPTKQAKRGDLSGLSRPALLTMAARARVVGRSRMRKDELIKALG